LSCSGTNALEEEDWREAEDKEEDDMAKGEAGFLGADGWNRGRG
jgi:hypothetical protein